MLPLSDGIPARRFPIVNVLLIVANFAVFTFYELPHLNTAAYHASFCRAASRRLPGAGAVGPQLDHRHVPARRRDRILGNMLFLAIFGKNVEDAFGSLPTSSSIRRLRRDDDADRDDPLFGPASTRVPELGASGAVAATGEARRPSRTCAPTPDRV